MYSLTLKRISMSVNGCSETGLQDLRILKEITFKSRAAVFVRIKTLRVPALFAKGSEIVKVQQALVRAAADTRGAVAIEFGFVVIPLVLLMMGVFQIGYTYYEAASLDLASNAGARAIMTGAVSTAGLNASQFTQTYICAQLPLNFNCSNVVVNVVTVLKAPAPAMRPGPLGPIPTVYYNYVNSARNALLLPKLTTSLNPFCPGAGYDLILLQVLYPTPLFTALFQNGSGVTQLDGSYVYYQMSSATFKNEPFVNAVTYTGCP
jgi:Flp pilus assembly protein TadG